MYGFTFEVTPPEARRLFACSKKKKKKKDFNCNPSWPEVADMELIRLSILRS